MKILAIDSSGLVASVAVVNEEELLAEYSVQYQKTHSQTLLPMLNEVKNMIDLDLDTVDAIAIAAGPGSFTGLRIGSATVKGLGLALNKPIIEVPTLEGLAYNMYGSYRLVCPIMDARRNQVYTGIYRFIASKEGYIMDCEWEQRAADIQDLIAACNELGEGVCFLGDGVPVYRNQLKEGLKIPPHFAPAHMNRQSAASVAALAQIYAKAGKMVSAAEHQPEYLRKSQAEREREEANGNHS